MYVYIDTLIDTYIDIQPHYSKLFMTSSNSTGLTLEDMTTSAVDVVQIAGYLSLPVNSPHLEL